MTEAYEHAIRGLPQPDACPGCWGCGKVANDDDSTPWIVWLDLPLRSSLAVLAGIVRPLPCPACGGSGIRPQRQEAPDA